MQHPKKSLSQYGLVWQRGRLRAYAEKQLPQQMRMLILAGRCPPALRKPNPLPLPVWIPGTPGYRTRPGRSGLDYLESEWELAHMEGVFLRRLFTLRLRTRDPYYLGLMVVFGLLPFLAGWVMLLQAISSGRYNFILVLTSSVCGWILFVFAFAPLVFVMAGCGALIANLVASLLELRKKSER